MYELPATLLAEVDQSKAHADLIVNKMVESLAEDLEAGVDASRLWYCYTGAVIPEDHCHIAAVLTSALLRLAALEKKAS
jgi:hypothetical protein